MYEEHVTREKMTFSNTLQMPNRVTPERSFAKYSEPILLDKCP